MADIFLKVDVENLLKSKKIVFIGDSNMRSVYKDLVVLSQENRLAKHEELKIKGENSFNGDFLLYNNPKGNGRDFREERKYQQNDFDFSFYFITRIYSDYMETILKQIASKHPDVVVVNSCVWDISRWGPHGVEEYKNNLEKLMKIFKTNISEKCIVIWTTTPPVSQMMKGGFLVEGLEFLKYSFCFHIIEANNFSRTVIVKNGYDVLDVHYHLRFQLDYRADDGVHWLPPAVRHVTNLILTHIGLSLDVSLPQRYRALISERVEREFCISNDTGYEFESNKTSSASNKTVCVVDSETEVNKLKAKSLQACANVSNNSSASNVVASVFNSNINDIIQSSSTQPSNRRIKLAIRNREKFNNSDFCNLLIRTNSSTETENEKYVSKSNKRNICCISSLNPTGISKESFSDIRNENSVSMNNQEQSQQISLKKVKRSADKSAENCFKKL